MKWATAVLLCRPDDSSYVQCRKTLFQSRALSAAVCFPNKFKGVTDKTPLLAKYPVISLGATRSRQLPNPSRVKPSSSTMSSVVFPIPGSPDRKIGLINGVDEVL